MDPIRELANLLDARAGSQARRLAQGISCELGTITPGGLKLDGFKHEIRDYLVAEYLTLAPDWMTETEATDHLHRVKTPAQLKPLQPGDRVLVIPVNGGQDFVVVGRVTNV